MKKIKYLIGIIVICILVFIGIEIFSQTENEELQNSNNSINENIDTSTDQQNTTTEENNTTQESNIEQINTKETEEITTGEELLEKAEKTLTARGWAGASNNVIGLKDGIIYYYNKATGEFHKIAEGIEDIYYKTELSEDIIAKKNSEFKEENEAPEFVIYE